MKEELFTNQKEINKAIKAAENQARKVKVIRAPSVKERKEICSVCERDFDLDAEGGTKGEFGILPVAFCPTCLSSIHDMVDQFNKVK